MNVRPITSLDDPNVSIFSRLTEAQLRRRIEPEKGLFIAESTKVIRVALASGIKPVSFLAEEKHIDTQVRPLVEQYCPEVPVFTAAREVLAQLTGYELSRGVLCAMQRPALPQVASVVDGCTRIAVADGVVNSENTGALFRAAAALGIDAVLLTHSCCDPLNRRACRVSMGTVFQLPWTYLDTYSQLRANGFTLVATALTDNSLPIDDARLKSISRMAIVMGAEGDGLPNEVIDLCDYTVRIPMQRGVDSLNVAAAAAVAFYELTKKSQHH